MNSVRFLKETATGDAHKSLISLVPLVLLKPRQS